MIENENINPEDYWKEAEQLLDSHFRKKRNRKIILLLLLLFISSAGIFSLVYNESSNTNTSNTGTNEPEVVATTNGNEIKSENASEKSKTPRIETNSSKNNLTSETNETVHSDKNENFIKHNYKAKGEKHENTHIREVQSPQPALTISSGGLYPSPAAVNSSSPSSTNVNSDEPSLSLPTTNGTLSLSPSLSFTEFSNHNKEIIPFLSPIETKTKSKSNWDLLIYGGASYTDKTVKGISNVEYTERRNNEEHAVVLPNMGLQVSHSKGDWDFRAGFELSVLGEKVSYSPYSKGEYYNNYKDWEEHQYSITDTDSVYVFGILFLKSTIVNVTDSVLVDKTDTLNGTHYNPAIESANGVNKRYVLEVPLEITYQLSRSRFGVGISAGVAPGLVIKQKGNYLRSDENGTAALQDESSRQFTFNARAALEFSYSLNEHIRLLLRPSGRIYFTGIKEKYGAENKYRSVGLNVGIMYGIR